MPLRHHSSSSGPGKVFVVPIHHQPDAVRTLTKAGLSRRLNIPSPIEMWPKAVPVFRYLRFVSDQEPASLQLTEIVSAGSIDFNPIKAPDVAPIDGPEIVTALGSQRGYRPVSTTSPLLRFPFCPPRPPRHLGRAVEAGARGALGSSEQPERATSPRPDCGLRPPRPGNGAIPSGAGVEMQTLLNSAAYELSHSCTSVRIRRSWPAWPGVGCRSAI